MNRKQLLICNNRDMRSWNAISAVGWGEIDIIAREGEYLCFVEVKYRSGDGYGSPLEAVGVYKQRKIIKVAHYYMMRKRLGLYMPCRFDVIAIEKDQITLLRNAFGES